MSNNAFEKPMAGPPSSPVFVPPSISTPEILRGASYTYHSAIPSVLTSASTTECVLGIDEAGRGPVLGPMVYGLFYIPLSLHTSLLTTKHHFDDSKQIKPEVRSSLLEAICTVGSDLYENCGWATRVMSARDISADMLKPQGPYNLNAQAMDATIQLIKEVLAKGVNVTEIYIDTVGKAETYQRKLQRMFPAQKITVAEKADSKFPCVSAASVCAKVTRDVALEVAYDTKGRKGENWGSGYPGDAKTVAWLKANLDPLFGWEGECRFSWSTLKTMLENKELAFRVDWPDPDEGSARMTDFFITTEEKIGRRKEEGDELAGWYGRPVAEAMI